MFSFSRNTEWGSEWSCPAEMDFCAMEAMCNYPGGTCPVNSIGKYEWRLCVIILEGLVL